MENSPFISIIIPVRNEEKYIGRCLSSILCQDYPSDKMEVILVDGMSEDQTIEKIKEIFDPLKSNKRKLKRADKDKGIGVRILNNPRKIVPCALNVGIKEARGDLIIRMDAHAEYARNYISKCVDRLRISDADNVGGTIKSIPGGNTLIGNAIALASANTFGVGNSKFRTSHKAEYVDTVAFGAWPRWVFGEKNLFDERLARNQDIEFNARIRKEGGKVFLTPEIKSFYRCKETLMGLWRQNFENGKWVVYTKMIAPYTLSYRHFVPFLFVLSLILSLVFAPFVSVLGNVFISIVCAYLLSSIFFSTKISFVKGLRYFFVLPLVFATLHFSYGLGSVWGLVNLKRWIKKIGSGNTC
jgi:glycosyltransferase involved in cell wall biosynthesis